MYEKGKFIGNNKRIYNTIQYKTYNAPYVTKMLFVGAGIAISSSKDYERNC